MTTTMTRYPGSTMAPEIFAWLESVLPFSSWRSVAVEEYTDDHGYVLRAELPGRNPEKDISVTVADGALTIGQARAGQARRPAERIPLRRRVPHRRTSRRRQGGRRERELPPRHPGDPRAAREVLDAAPGAGFVR